MDEWPSDWWIALALLIGMAIWLRFIWWLTGGCNG